MSIGPPARGWRFTLWNDRIRFAVAPVVLLLFAVLIANVVEIPGTEPWLRQGPADSLLVVAATALLGSTTAICGTGPVRCRRNTSIWGGCEQMMRSIIGLSLRFRPLVIGRAAAAIIFVISASACAGANPDRVTGGSNPKPEQATAKDFDPNRFDQSPNIDNEWLPEKPGTQFVYEGSAISDEGRRISRRVVTTITDLTKVIDGVRTVVIWDRDYDNGRLVEGEIAFHAQDNDGNVWLLGEYPEEYEGGRFVGAPSTWIAGMEGAKPGILMRATPQPGTSSYSQGLAPASEFTDRAEVYKVGQKTCVPVDCYRNVLVTSEWDASDPEEGVQRKYHAPDVGYVRVGFKPGDEEEEALVLEEIRHLSSEERTEVRQQALKLDKRAYEVRKELYGHTSPAEPRIPRSSSSDR